jgi:hypothetical protein
MSEQTPCQQGLSSAHFKLAHRSLDAADTTGTSKKITALSDDDKKKQHDAILWQVLTNGDHAI